MARLFTNEELEELRRADEKIEEEFSLTEEDIRLSQRLDREAKLDKLDNRGRKIAEYQVAYREANKDKIRKYKRSYYLKRCEAKKKAASRCARPESSIG